MTTDPNCPVSKEEYLAVKYSETEKMWAMPTYEQFVLGWQLKVEGNLSYRQLAYVMKTFGSVDICGVSWKRVLKRFGYVAKPRGKTILENLEANGMDVREIARTARTSSRLPRKATPGERARAAVQQP